MEQINPLKKINLEQYQKPKTLIVVHYKGKRISVPLLQNCKNLTQMLYQHIDKFQQTVLKAESSWQILSSKKIVCFQSYFNSDQKNNRQNNNLIKKNIQRFLKYPDGDLKIDLLLSLIRIQGRDSRNYLDITKYYKYMEIQPYFIQYPLRNNTKELQKIQNKLNRLSKYYFYRLLEKNRMKNVYLCRNLQNGYFYSIKVYRNTLAVSEHQVTFLKAINQEYSKKQSSNRTQNYYAEQQQQNQQQDTVVPPSQIYMIPSSQQQEQEEDEDETNNCSYKHLAIAFKYNIKGKLSDKLLQKNSKITQNQLLKYLKQLVWIAYTLHEKNLVPECFQIDHFGNLKLTTFNSWLQCYNEDGELISYPSDRQYSSNRSNSNNSSRLYQQQFQFVGDGWYSIGHYTPTEVINKAKQGYNKYVDYYTIGIVIKQIYQKVYQWGYSMQQNNTKGKLIKQMIEGLTSQNYQQREQIVLEIIQGIKKSKEQNDQTVDKEIALNLSQIKLGSSIPFNSSSVCVQNEDNDLNFNGIIHQEIVDYFKPSAIIPLAQKQSFLKSSKKAQQKQKKKPISFNQNKNHKDDPSSSHISNSRDKSVKSVKSTKSNKSNLKNQTSKQKIRTKSKLFNQKSTNLNQKQKSKSHKKLIVTSPQKIASNTHHVGYNTNTNYMGHTNSLKQTRSPNQKPSIPPKKQKSKSTNKSKKQRSLQKNTTLEHGQKGNNYKTTGNMKGGPIQQDYRQARSKDTKKYPSNVPLPKSNVFVLNQKQGYQNTRYRQKYS